VTADLEARLASVRSAGRKAFVPFVTGGFPGVDDRLLRDLAATGADAVEVGIPFSDPVMDGPVIQEASRRALAQGATPAGSLALVRRAGLDVPVAVMTYLNPVLAYGEERFVEDAADAGVTGAIVPDLPVDEAGPWIDLCRRAGLATVFLAAPNSSPDRLRKVAGASRGFVYCVSTYGVTGTRARLSDDAEGVVQAIRPLTETPLLVGVGVSTPEQAAQACAFADGVVVGSALMALLLEGRRDGFLERAEAYREAVSPDRSGTERSTEEGGLTRAVSDPGT
jgi:tryptophan synthase alpha chain